MRRDADECRYSDKCPQMFLFTSLSNFGTGEYTRRIDIDNTFGKTMYKR